MWLTLMKRNENWKSTMAEKRQFAVLYCNRNFAWYYEHLKYIPACWRCDSSSCFCLCVGFKGGSACAEGKRILSQCGFTKCNGTNPSIVHSSAIHFILFYFFSIIFNKYVIVVSLFNSFVYFHFNKLISTRKNLNIIALKRGDVLATKFDSKETARTIIKCSQFVEHK